MPASHSAHKPKAQGHKVGEGRGREGGQRVKGGEEEGWTVRGKERERDKEGNRWREMEGETVEG